MLIKPLTAKDYPKLKKIKKRYEIKSVIDINNGKLEIVEFFNKDGVFRGFGKNTKEALKKAKKVLKSYYER